MVRYLEPCCYSRQLTELINACECDTGARIAPGCTHFFSNSDWDAVQLLAHFAGYAEGGTLHVAMIHLDHRLLSCIKQLLQKQRVDPADRSRTLPYINKVYLVTQPNTYGSAAEQHANVRASLGAFIEQGRLLVAEDNIGFRCFAAANDHHHLVIQGSINPQVSNAVQMFTLTATTTAHEAMSEVMESICRVRNGYRDLTPKEGVKYKV